MMLFDNSSRGINSFLGKWETSHKILSLFLLILVNSTLTSKENLFIITIFVFICCAFSKISISFWYKRLLWLFFFTGLMLVILPFTVPGVALKKIEIFDFLIIASYEGTEKALLLAFRLSNAFLLIGLLLGTTPLNKILEGLHKIKIPVIFINLMGFTIRYYYLFVQEINTMKTAREARGFKHKGFLWDKSTRKTIASLIGILFIRATERSERVYLAMLSRGFKGLMPLGVTNKPILKDWLLTSIFLLFSLLVKIMEWSGFDLWEFLK